MTMLFKNNAGKPVAASVVSLTKKSCTAVCYGNTNITAFFNIAMALTIKGQQLRNRVQDAIPEPSPGSQGVTMSL